MSVRNWGTQAGLVLAVLVLGLALTTCSSNKAAEKPAPQSAAAGNGQSTEAATESKSATQPSTETEATRPGQEQATQPGAEAESRTGAEMTPLGDRVEIRTSWVQVRAKPSKDAPAIALAFGNDTYTVLGHEGNWVHVRLDEHREGWIPLSATQP